MKTCNYCSIEKPLSEFGKNSRRESGLQTECKDCHGIKRRAWYAANRKHYIEKSKARRKDMREALQRKVWDYRLAHPCIDCGESDPIVLEFAHRDATEKVIGIAKAVQDIWPWERLLAEIDKCDVKCANCHRRDTAVQLGWWAG